MTSTDSLPLQPCCIEREIRLRLLAERAENLRIALDAIARSRTETAFAKRVDAADAVLRADEWFAAMAYRAIHNPSERGA